jgi:hypothetical protein
MTTKQQIHETRWGFVPCDYETYLKLKKAHKLLLRAYQDCKRNIRWNNKEPQNQKGPEPRAPKDFIEHGYHKLDKKHFYGLGFRRVSGPGWQKNLYLHILEQYQKARRPVEKPEDVQPLNLPADLDEIIERLEQFYGESDKDVDVERRIA